MEKKNNIPEAIMEKIKKYPELEESVNDYLKSFGTEDKKNLSLHAAKALNNAEDVKPLDVIFQASVGTDGDVPAEVMDVLKKYPEFEEKVNAFLKTAEAERSQHLGIDALSVLEDHEGVEAVKLDAIKSMPTDLLEKLNTYPDVKEALDTYVKTMEKEKDLHLSAHAVKALEE